jgi:hypothetical protein
VSRSMLLPFSSSDNPNASEPSRPLRVTDPRSARKRRRRSRWGLLPKIGCIAEGQLLRHWSPVSL